MNRRMVLYFLRTRDNFIEIVRNEIVLFVNLRYYKEREVLI